ncbi:flagellin lysine-N-methylase [Paenibacillus enshidis]|uniref:Flagellin lysine-N-methylase n=1 Tax=Paenibacillus enshidis TaxID=1458439 RepID=A0ABV5AR78_9BACL
MNTNAALVPKYMLDFKCIGPECEDSCCIGWRVQIDKTTFTNLTSVPEKSLRESIKQGIEKIETQSRTNDQYATMKMDNATGCCSLLNDQKLCTIQASLGERYLAPICATYPRVIYAVNDQQEISSVMSCPEAARLALLNPDKMEFTYTDAMLQKNAQVKGKIATNQSPDSFMNFFWDIRIFAIEIIQNRRFSFPHRLMILGLFCEQLQQLIDQKLEQEDDINGLINRFRDMVANNEELQDYKTFPVDQEFQFITLNTIISQNLGSIGSNARFASCVQDYLGGMSEHEASDDTMTLVDFYKKGFVSYYEPFMEEYEYIFENYAVNFLYSHVFPRSESRNVFNVFIILVSHYAILKLLLIGISIKYKGLTSDAVLKLIQSFTKISEHTNVYVKNIIDFLNEKDYKNMGYVSLLIKN